MTLVNAVKSYWTLFEQVESFWSFAILLRIFLVNKDDSCFVGAGPSCLLGRNVSFKHHCYSISINYLQHWQF